MSIQHRATTLAASIMTIALLATGCAAEDKKSGGETGNKDVATGGESFGTADEETAKLGSDAEPGEFPRTVTHANGTTEIEKKPERVVVLDTGELDDVLSLGITPVGMVTTEGANPVPSYLEDQVEGVETVGTIQELDLEKIASLEPDLILGSQLRADKLYDELDSIAPTVFSIRPGFPWKENFRLVGEAMGMEDEATNELEDYAREAGELKDSVDGDPTISLVRFMPDRLRLYANQSLIGVILHDAGFKRPKIQDVDELAVEISPENLDQAGGDYVFYTSYGDPEATGETKALESSQWEGLDAVKDGKAIRVNDDVWFLGLGPTGAAQILEDLGDHLGE
ncbi:iron complex transport system substrate-binding protein [Brevibacterium siliguriense]|uniref:Iron complex transport system substrate-binding protein n=1 Tax=Brevibacterium siliguriense TaxID=1136497 RepID=A0A1H1P5J2_9MICO|nr:iron-siderophore ABC transporter substrate-binding protein [Brevibacterium siliguriense]SDS06433.1 iron complex transport system substrate-binding protein [Brevibacterium siliguriense]